MLSPIGSVKRSDVWIASTWKSMVTRLIDSVNEAAPCGDQRPRRLPYGRAVAQPTPRRGPRRAANGTLAGLMCWLVQPFYLVVELLVAAAASAPYSLRDGTISALGQVGCAPGHDLSAVAVCSNGHAVLNAAFVVFGLLRAIGALLLRGRIDPTWWRTAAVGLWVASGPCCAAVGLAPVDQHPLAHAWAAAPVFVMQPAAVLATAIALRRSADARSGVGTAGLVVGAVSLVGALAFGLRLGEPTWVGALERLALWPAYVWLGLVAATFPPGIQWQDRSRR